MLKLRHSSNCTGICFPTGWGSASFCITVHVRDYLNECFPQQWIGGDGPTAWPPRSPDLTSLDFFFWGYIKDIVYRTPVVDLENLRGIIVATCGNVTPEMLQNIWRELKYRLDDFRATRGAHIEIY